MDDIRKAINERILILDGAMGTMFQKQGLLGDNDSFNLKNPDAVEAIHKAYIAAGADIITTNSFGANRISQAEYGLSDSAGKMAEAAARIARNAADRSGRKVWVAGSIGPTGKSLSLAQDISDPASRQYSFDDMAAAFEEQILGLLKGGADLVLMETCFDALNTKAAIYALKHIPEAQEVPVMVSVSLSDRSGRTLTGQTMEAFYRSVQHAPLFSFGLNCSFGAKSMVPLIAEVSTWAECSVSCYPNAGLPDEMGEYDETPAETASFIREMALAGTLNIAGGCCGTTPEHIRAISEAVRGLTPRTVPELDNILHVSGLEAVAIDKEKNNFTNVGERTNVAGSRKFASLIASGDYETALKVAAGQVGSGASVIDINMDDAMLDSKAEMEKFLRYVSNDPAVAKAAIMIDSSHWDTIIAGLKNAQGKCIVNSISLKEGEEAFLEKALEIKSLGAAAIVIAFDEKGQATTYDRKIEICARAYSLLVRKTGFRPSDIIFDVNVLPVGTGISEHSRYAADFIEAVRWIKRNLPGALTSGGISNLSFSFRGNSTVREAMHSAFLYHAIAAGLDMGIVNPSMLKVYDDIEPELLKCVEDVILDRDPDATERLLAKAAETLQSATDKKDGEPARKSSLSAGERLSQAIVKGDSSSLEEDIKESLSQLGKAVQVIEGPLMTGMAKVGELFGSGKMFLPQVVKSAKIMKSAVAILQPEMEKENGAEVTRKPKVLMATVKGDVHDIGKNITSIVLNCNGFEICDLGVMVPKETILEKASEHEADIIGVSGLITPSLHQMEELCKDMEAKGMETPLLVGGAAASALHTAVKLAPLYGHVFYGQDASSSAVLASHLMSDRTGCEKQEHEKQAELRKLYARSRQNIHQEKDVKPFPASSFIRGKHFADIPARRLSIAEDVPFFDWSLFFTIWGMKAGKGEEEKSALKRDAESELARLKDNEDLSITLSARFEACHSEGNDIVSSSFRLPMFRQEGGGRSLADFVAPEAYGFESPMGMFAVSVQTSDNPMEGCGCEDCSTEYGPMLARAVRLTLAEAASRWLDAELSRELPEGSDAKIVKPAAGYSSCPDHTLKRDILKFLPESRKLGIRLLDSCAMIPEASICGLIFIHPEASYPEIRRLDQAAIDEYARRRRMTEEEKNRFLGHLL